MEVDGDLGEGTSRAIASLNGHSVTLSLRELEARAVEWPGGEQDQLLFS